MDCRDVQSLLAPYSDGELDLVRHLQIEHHLAECTGCAESARGLKLLRDAVSSAPLYHRAPAGLREKLLAAPATPAPPRRSRRPSFALVATAAGVLLLVGAVVAGGVFLSRGGEDRLAEQVAAGHARSLQVTHLTDVASSDRHTVKPWFLGKVDFSPRVSDFAAHGYALTGGRLDYLAERPVAALVYHRRAHVINLFTWPAADETDRPVKVHHRHGFHIRHWQRSGMTYWAVSDLNAEELDAFVHLLRESTPTP